MAADPITGNFVNPDYTTPEQRARQYDYANFLLKNQMPVTGGRGGWAIGLANALSSAMGGYEAGKVDRSALSSRQQDIGNILQNVNPGQPQGQMPQQTSDGAEPRGIRNNNPGNIEDGPFAKSQPGYAGSDGRFAQFMTPEHGQNAASNLLANYGSKGVDTVAKVVNKWAPPSDNNPTSAYAAAVAKQLGVDPNQPLPMNDPGVRQKLASAMFQFENGKPVQMASLGNGIPGQPSPQPQTSGGPQVAQNAPNPMQPPSGQPQPLPINTRLIGAALNASNLSPAAVNSVMGMAQPQLVDGPGGKYDLRTGQLVMPEFQKGKMKVGDTEFETSSQYDPRSQTWKTTPLLPSGGLKSGPDLSTIGGLQDISAEGARKKEVATEFGKAQVVPIGEAQKEAKTSANALNALNIIEDVAKTHGDKITTGPFGEDILKLKQAVNGITGTQVMGDTSQAELIKKMNAQLASAALPAFTNRGTQFDLKTFMENNPGLNNSIKGTLFLTNILKQVHRQQFELSQLASDPKNVGNWPTIQKNYYDAHPLVNPLTNTPLGVTKDTQEQQQTGAPANTPQETKTIGNKTYYKINGQWHE